MDCFPTSIPSKRSKTLLAYVRISSRHIIFACATATNNQKYLRLLLDMVPLQSLLGFLENFLSSSATRPGAGQQPVASRSNVALPVANAQKHRIHPHITNIYTLQIAPYAQATLDSSVWHVRRHRRPQCPRRWRSNTAEICRHDGVSVLHTRGCPCLATAWVGCKVRFVWLYHCIMFANCRMPCSRLAAGSWWFAVRCTLRLEKGRVKGQILAGITKPWASLTQNEANMTQNIYTGMCFVPTLQEQKMVRGNGKSD